MQNCDLFVIGDRRTSIHGSITAQSRESEHEDSGFSFVNTTVYGTDDVFLGRAKNEFSRVVFALSYLSDTITPAGWTSWSFDGPTEYVSFTSDPPRSFCTFPNS